MQLYEGQISMADLPCMPAGSFVAKVLPRTWNGLCHLPWTSLAASFAQMQWPSMLPTAHERQQTLRPARMIHVGRGPSCLICLVLMSC